MSNMAKGIASAMGYETESRWSDFLDELDNSDVPETQTETEQEVKSRLLAKLNGREGA
jgi:hypothetical protein